MAEVQQKSYVQIPTHSLPHLNNYTLLQIIATGGFSTVYMAIQHHTKKSVAIKIVPKNHPDSLAQACFYNQVEILRQIRHPSIVNILETIITEQHLCIVQQYCSGGDLLSKLQKKGRLSQSEANNILLEIIEALIYLDHKKINHRDIKPENILFDRFSKLKLCDFGLACRNPQNIFFDEHCGSSSYMSPQIVAKLPYYPLTSDIWSLGVLYHAMLTGQMLFPGEQGSSTKEEILGYDYTIPWNIPINCRTIFQMMVNHPEKRATLEQLKEQVSKDLGIPLQLEFPPKLQSTFIINETIVNKIKFYTKNSPENILKSLKQKILNHDYALYHLMKITQYRPKSSIEHLSYFNRSLNIKSKKTQKLALDSPGKKNLSTLKPKRGFQQRIKGQKLLTPIIESRKKTRNQFIKSKGLFSNGLIEQAIEKKKEECRINRQQLKYRLKDRNLKYLLD